MTLMFGLCAVAALSVVPAPRTISVADGEIDARSARIVESRDAAVAREGYRLTVSPEGVSVVAADDAGAFYARETLKQLEEDGKYPCCTVDDAPAYRWRGVMIDEARHFLGKKAVKRLLDLMAMNKLNVLHWHLTDDQGWRLEIRRHPELVTYGAVRPRSVKYGSPTQWKDGKIHYDLDNDPYGPFYYTHEDVREILAYAKARQVTVVPEIELPGHERALLAAHPEFSCRGDLPRIPRLFWSIEDDVICAGNDAAMKYLEEIFDEVCELFPDAPFIHIGGDECPRVRWEKCPKCQARMKALGLKETSDLQSWMTARFVRYLERKGRRAVGWDEVLAGDVPQSTVGMTWRESAKAGAGTHYVSAPEAVRRGHDVVMTPNAKTYLSRPQGFAKDPYPYYSPKGPGIDLKCAYSFDPAAGIPAEGRSHIIGGQASVWGEFVWNAADLEWKTWPRACAIAEALWTAPAKRDYADFRARMMRHRERLLAAGANCAPLDRDETFFNPLGRCVEIALGNPGFEEGRTGGWSFSRNHFVDERGAHGGRRCARIEVADPQKDGVYLTYRVPVEPGRTYCADCFIRTEGVTTAKGRMSSVGACLIVEWNDANGKWCAAGKRSKSFWGTNGWTRVCCDRVKAPANARSATVFLALRGKGTAWFDDVRFVRIETATDKLVPADGTAVACNTPKFTWRPRPMARRYRLQLSRDESFKTARAYDVGGFTEWRLEEPLEPGDWFWRVSSDGDDDARPYVFTQTAPASRDCLPPLVLTKACRVTDGGQEVRVKVRDLGKACPTVTLLGQKGVCDGPATDGVWTFRFAAPSGGWAKGLVETRVAATDAAGNAAETDFWLLNAPKPPNANRIGKDGFFHEDAGRIYPLGIYQVEPKDMSEVRACGFDAVHTYKWERSQDDAGCRAYLDRCWAADGLRAFVGFDRGNGSKNGIVQGNFGSVARRVGALADHPGLFLWYLFDEPEIADYFVSPDLLTAFADLVRTLDPYHTVVMTTWGGTMNEYRRTWDTHWTQAYGNPREVIDLLAEHRTCLKNDSPITLLVNCNDHGQSQAWRANKVPPDPSKFARDYDFLRACALLGVVKGCNGVWWWWFARGNKDYFSAASSPSAWANMRKVVAELRDLRPLVTADGEVKSGTVTVGKDKVEWWTKTVGGKSTLIAINTADHAVTAELDVPGFGKVEHTFARYEVKRLQQAVAPVQAGGTPYEDRWFYCSHDFRTDADIDFYRTLVNRAAKSGYNGMLFARGLEGAAWWKAETKARFAEVKAICEAAKVEIVPILWSVGYGTMIGVDDGLAESCPVKDLPFVAKGGKAVYRADGVTLLNGDFAERDMAKNRLRGWWTDDPGIESFVDTNVCHAGKASVRFEADKIRNKHGHARLSQTIRDLRPGRHYRFVTHVKTDGFQPRRGALRAQVYLKGGGNLARDIRGRADADGWVRTEVTFNSGDATNATVYVGAWGAKGGRFWVSDSTLEECGLTEIATRPWCTVEIRDAATGRAFREGVDFLRPAQMRGPKNGPVEFTLPKGSAIADGTRLSVDAWTPSHCGPSSQLSTCMSDPKLYDLFRASARGVMEVLAPRKWFLSVDEVRNGNTCPMCRARQTDMAHVFGDAITQMHGIIKSVRPDATVYAWSDMFDPGHNCHDNYFACRGTFAGVCDLIPKDIVMSCWYRKICRASVAYFTSNGFRVQGAGYYDYDADDTAKDLAWIDVLNATPKATGLMYTTWQGKYDLLEKFGQMMLEKGRVAVPAENDR